MKTASEIAEKQSERVFWVIQTIFGFIIARSFYEYASVYVPPFDHDWITLSLALLSVYGCVLWSWIDFSYALVVSPYNFGGKARLNEKFRFLTDLLIVLAYCYLLLCIGKIKLNADAKIVEFFYAFSLVFFLYALSGFLRILEYGRRASRIGLILLFFVFFCALLYEYHQYTRYGSTTQLNRIFFSISLGLTVFYRVARSRFSKRRLTIGVDVDGVLANQIHGILPVIKAKFGLELKYEDVTDWRLTIKDSSIDKLIVEQQKQKSYVVGMPVHPQASKALNELVKKHYIAIATARPSDADLWTKQWLKNNNIPYDSYYNLKEGGKQNAAEDFDILIDDYPPNIVAFLEGHNGKAILFSQPWNSDGKLLEQYVQTGRVAIVKSWIEVPNKVSELLAVK